MRLGGISHAQKSMNTGSILLNFSLLEHLYFEFSKTNLNFDFIIYIYDIRNLFLKIEIFPERCV